MFLSIFFPIKKFQSVTLHRFEFPLIESLPQLIDHYISLPSTPPPTPQPQPNPLPTQTNGGNQSLTLHDQWRKPISHFTFPSSTPKHRSLSLSLSTIQELIEEMFRIFFFWFRYDNLSNFYLILFIEFFIEF